MSIRYRKVQNKIAGSVSQGKWYGKSVSLSTISTKDLAEEISHSTTVTRADIMAVLIELAEAMKRHLLASETVSLEGLGSFRVGLKSDTADKKEDYNATKIKGYRIIFSPETTFTATGVNENGHRIGYFTKTLIAGATAAELVVNGTTDTTVGG